MGAYFLGRELTGRRLPSPTRDLLLRANESRKEVLEQMPYGRCNVRPDLRATDNEGLYRVLARRRVIGDLSTLGSSPAVARAREAALAAFAGSGNCSEFAEVAEHFHAARLREAESVSFERASDWDHGWTKVQGSAGTQGQIPAAVIDAWGEGPVVEPSDYRFIAEASAPILTEHVISSADAAHASRVFQASVAEPDPRTTRRFDLLVQANRNQDRQPSGRIYEEPLPIVRSQLIEAARTAIEHHAAPIQLRQRAAELARDVAGVPADRQAEAAEIIIEMAANLDKPLQRPLGNR